MRSSGVGVRNPTEPAAPRFYLVKINETGPARSGGGPRATPVLDRGDGGGRRGQRGPLLLPLLRAASRFPFLQLKLSFIAHNALPDFN